MFTREMLLIHLRTTHSGKGKLQRHDNITDMFKS